MFVRDTEKRTNPRCVQDGLGLIPYSPLAQGLLSEKYLDGTPPEGSRAENNENCKSASTSTCPPCAPCPSSPAPAT
jgi:aryl-alcohol dehydrogenase-like predicted oxidoreductase